MTGASRAATSADFENANAEAGAAPAASGRLVSRVDWLLRAAILIQMAGVAVAIFTRAGTAAGEVALLEYGISHDQIFLWERIVAGVLLAAAASLLVYPATLTLLVISGAILFEVAARYIAGGQTLYEYTLGALALRYLTPLALIMLVMTPKVLPSVRFRATAAMWILRIGVACVFITHGIEALRLHPAFIDFIIGSGRNLFGWSIQESTAGEILTIIGGVDIAVALLVLIRPWRPLLAWLAFWGLITALARPVSHGFASYPEVLLRITHILAPIAIWWLASAVLANKEIDRQSRPGKA